MDALRTACAEVASRARFVTIDTDAIDGYARSLPLPEPAADGAAESRRISEAEREHRAAFWLTLDAVNFGSGWFPTLRKRDGRSGYHTIATGLSERFERTGPWSADELGVITLEEVARAVGQEPTHELMDLFARSLRDLGAHLTAEHDGRFAAVADAADGSATALATRLGTWECFADNLVPHVLRLDGVLHFNAALVHRIEREELITHDSPEEVEIRACALHAVELIVAARPGTSAAMIDQLLWTRGGEARYKAAPRHRSRCTAY